MNPPQEIEFDADLEVIRTKVDDIVARANKMLVSWDGYSLPRAEERGMILELAMELQNTAGDLLDHLGEKYPERTDFISAKRLVIAALTENLVKTAAFDKKTLS